MLEDIALAFIPIFIAVDAIGVLPIFLNFTSEMEQKLRQKIIIQSCVFAFLVSTGFIIIGKAVFNSLGIEIEDFMIAGGILLFCISILNIIKQQKTQRIPVEELSFVPLGTPLIAGPAVLTTSLIISEQFGIVISIISIALNLIIACIIFSLSEILIKIIGKSGSKALSKITSLLLAAIAVMMIRKGLLATCNI